MKLKKIIPLVLCGVVLLFAGVVAASGTTEMPYYETDWELNPLYEGGDTLSVPAPTAMAGEQQTPKDDTPSFHTSYDTAAAVLRAGLKAHESAISVVYRVEGDYTLKEIYSEIFALALAHTGVADEGEYLTWHWQGRKVGVSTTVSGTTTDLKLTYYMTYYTTVEQEAAVTEKVNAVLDSLALSDQTDYEKIKGIYDYICKTVVYDNANAGDTTYTLKFTCYAALMEQRAVCQGYATLFYRLATTLGLDARVIYGTGGGVSHAWNIVRVGDSWFHLDATWDAGLLNYNFFLKGWTDFAGHTRLVNPLCGLYYSRSSYYAAYPMARTSYLPSVPDEGISGTCGDGVFWRLSADGGLTVFGTGAVVDYESTSAVPWSEYAHAVREIALDDGITRIGDNAFGDCMEAVSLYLPDTLTETGTNAIPPNGETVRTEGAEMTISGTAWLSGTTSHFTEQENGRRFLVIKEEQAGICAGDVNIIAFTECFTGGTDGTENRFRLVSGDGSRVYSSPTAVQYGMRFQQLDKRGGVEDDVTLIRLGDVNGDCDLNSEDAGLLFKYSMVPDLYPIPYPDTLDYTRDGKVDIADALKLFRYSMFPDLYPIT